MMRSAGTMVEDQGPTFKEQRPGLEEMEPAFGEQGPELEEQRMASGEQETAPEEHGQAAGEPAPDAGWGAAADEDGMGALQGMAEETEAPMHHNQALGAKGEEAAVHYLVRKGYEICDRNWRCKAGEVDIVAEDADALAFVEVKTRISCERGFPEEAVDSGKRRRYEKIAGFYLNSHEVGDKEIRFDVISILVIAPERAFLRHHKNAFMTCE